ncbi:MAG: hypothetical protein Q8O17_02010 [Candidatus Methanoperedens sp.]|nr:hypothetical protein [Candidatus Methanoperedens sp.]
MNDKEDAKPDRFLDCIGLFCPIPIFNTTQEMEKIEKGHKNQKKEREIILCISTK